MLFAHLKRILRLDRLRLTGPSGPRRVPPGCHCLEPPKAGKADPAGCSEARLSTSVPAHACPFDPFPNGWFAVFFNTIPPEANNCQTLISARGGIWMITALDRGLPAYSSFAPSRRNRLIVPQRFRRHGSKRFVCATPFMQGTPRSRLPRNP
jgi:hypothetical protein